jgi:hypothetical protein
MKVKDEVEPFNFGNTTSACIYVNTRCAIAMHGLYTVAKSASPFHLPATGFLLAAPKLASYTQNATIINYTSWVTQGVGIAVNPVESAISYAANYVGDGVLDVVWKHVLTEEQRQSRVAQELQALAHIAKYELARIAGKKGAQKLNKFMHDRATKQAEAAKKPETTDHQKELDKLENNAAKAKNKADNDQSTLQDLQEKQNHRDEKIHNKVEQIMGAGDKKPLVPYYNGKKITPEEAEKLLKSGITVIFKGKCKKQEIEIKIKFADTTQLDKDVNHAQNTVIQSNLAANLANKIAEAVRQAQAEAARQAQAEAVRQAQAEAARQAQAHAEAVSQAQAARQAQAEAASQDEEATGSAEEEEPAEAEERRQIEAPRQAEEATGSAEEEEPAEAEERRQIEAPRQAEEATGPAEKEKPAEAVRQAETFFVHRERKEPRIEYRGNPRNAKKNNTSPSAVSQGGMFATRRLGCLPQTFGDLFSIALDAYEQEKAAKSQLCAQNMVVFNKL